LLSHVARLLICIEIHRGDRICFFFSSRRRHTRCLSDWSSDVCSSDLLLHHWYAASLGLQNSAQKGQHPSQALWLALASGAYARRSEERRVGKECRSRWSPDQ